jgi:hypothetical protein
LLIAVFLLKGTGAAAQNGWIPPVSIPANTQLCDNTPYKLVLTDDFNGTTLKPHWITYNSWAGMRRIDHITSNNDTVYIFGDHEDWADARGSADGSSINLTENIEVSNGTVKLKTYHDTHTWQCATCGTPPVTKHYTPVPF